MGQSVTVMGMVLTAMPVNDYDKRITILTRERGKITAFARGARRPSSPLLAATDPFSFGEFEVYEGRNAYNVAKANIQRYFRDFAKDLETASLAFYFAEFSQYFCQENNDEREMLKLLYQSLCALEDRRYDRRLVRLVFELRAITINGEGPQMFACMSCRTKENLRVFSAERGGMLCGACASKGQGLELSESARYALQYIVSTPIARLYSFAVTPEVLAELVGAARAYMARHVRHEFKSLGIFG